MFLNMNTIISPTSLTPDQLFEASLFWNPSPFHPPLKNNTQQLARPPNIHPSETSLVFNDTFPECIESTIQPFELSGETGWHHHRYLSRMEHNITHKHIKEDFTAFNQKCQHNIHSIRAVWERPSSRTWGYLFRQLERIFNYSSKHQVSLLYCAIAMSRHKCKHLQNV